MTKEKTRTPARKKGSVRDAIIAHLADHGESSIAEIHKALSDKLGPVARSSVRSSLNLNVGTPGMLFERIGKGKYRLANSRQR